MTYSLHFYYLFSSFRSSTKGNIENYIENFKTFWKKGTNLIRCTKFSIAILLSAKQESIKMRVKRFKEISIYI